MTRILYLGDPAGGLALLERQLNVVGVIHGRRGGRGQRAFVSQVRGLPRWHMPNLNDAHMLDTLKALAPSLLVACFYPQRIPQALLDIVPGINIHPSDLPRWRGPDPCAWTIRSGDSQTAITVHWLTAGFDEGDIIKKWPIRVGPRETTGRLCCSTRAGRCPIYCRDRTEHL